MFELNELLKEIEKFQEEIKDLFKLLKIEYVKLKIEEYELKSLNDPNFWNNLEDVLFLNEMQSKLREYEELKELIKDTGDLILISISDEDLELKDYIYFTCQEIKNHISELKLSAMFDGEYDNNNVIFTIHAGAGGKEAQDWATMLYRMYCGWFNKNNYNYKVVDMTEGESGLIKSITLSVKGKYAYGYLQSEHGVHRLVRVSPFDSANRRHTSFAAVEVLPEVEQDMSLEVRPEDLKIDTYRSSGAGGQHINTTDSAVRITHLPTGIVVSCQTERSQIQNRDYAFKMLYSKLQKLKEQEHLDKISDLKGKQCNIEWGSQIRSYVFMPYQLVKDHRSDYEDANINKIMDGNIDDFILEYHKHIKKQP